MFALVGELVFFLPLCQNTIKHLAKLGFKFAHIFNNNNPIMAEKAKQLSVVTYEMDLREEERGRAVTLLGTPSFNMRANRNTAPSTILTRDSCLLE